MGDGYLHRCLALFPETMLQRHGSRVDYAGLENQLEPVRLKQRGFSYRDLAAIQDQRFWDFRQFWRFPDQGDIRREIDQDRLAGLFECLPLDEAEVIERLHAAFKYIQNVSVVLRFVHPDHYGILSPPVEKILEVRRGRTESDTYLNYLDDLRALRDHHGLARAADADMALWVLQERVLSAYRDPELLMAYRADAWLQRRRLTNLLAGVDHLEDRLELARALADVHTPLAGMLAAFEFERRLRAVLDAGRCPDLGDRIEAVAASHDRAAVESWRRGLRLRDRMHDPGHPPERREILALIDLAHRLGAAA
ncbi:MAG: hypothetical protein ACE5HU_00585 [Acidobacteriota bacterium]